MEFNSQQISEIILKIFDLHLLTLSLMLGYLCWNRELFGKAIALTLFSMIENPFLKSIWKIPLPDTVASYGWAFPSGHMQMIVCLLGVLFLGIPSRIIRIFFIVSLFFIALAIRHKGYHGAFDLAGGVFFGVLTVAAFYWMYTRPFFIQNPSLIPWTLAAISVPMLYALSIYDPTIHHYHAHGALGGLIALGLGWWLMRDVSRAESLLGRVVIGILGSIPIVYLMPEMTKELPAFLHLTDSEAIFKTRAVGIYVLPILTVTLAVPAIFAALRFCAKRCLTIVKKTI
jgi:hypothetical protein